MERLRLGVNIDHVATLRNARGGHHPDPVRAAHAVAAAGADGITAHLREDRRHIRDDDIARLCEEIALPLNLEIAATDEMRAVALRHRPHAVCIVPERREELTTEGGLDVIGAHTRLAPFVADLTQGGIRVALFIDPNPAQVEAAREVGANAVELHTGRYCDSVGPSRREEFERLRGAAAAAERVALECHAGHGLTYESVGPIAALPNVIELNIGHFLVGEALFCGLEPSIRRMRAAMDEARAAASAS